MRQTNGRLSIRIVGLEGRLRRDGKGGCFMTNLMFRCSCCGKRQTPTPAPMLKKLCYGKALLAHCQHCAELRILTFAGLGYVSVNDARFILANTPAPGLPRSA
jgi:hypothetical protein